MLVDHCAVPVSFCFFRLLRTVDVLIVLLLKGFVIHLHDNGPCEDHGYGRFCRYPRHFQ